MDWHGKSVLITGAAGFIGSHFARRLLKEGAHVHLLDLPDANTTRLHDCLDKGTLHHADLRDLPALQKICTAIRPEAVFHLAALVDTVRSWDRIRPMLEINLIGTLNLLTALEPCAPDIFLNIGSSEEYGNIDPPLVETLREAPTSPYSYSKTAVVHMCQMATRIFDRAIVNIRFFPTFGPFQEGAMLIPSAIRSLLTEGTFSMTAGEQLREFNYVEDVVEAALMLAGCSGISGEVVNIGCGVPVKVRTVAETIQKIVGGKTTLNTGSISMRKGEGSVVCCENTRFKELTGWSPRFTLEQGLRKTVDWHRQLLKS